MTQQEVPTGQAFLDAVCTSQDETQAETHRRLPELGTKAPACFEELGTAISYLDRMASCWFGCRGGDHLIECLCARASSQALAALRLTRLGFYDEALLLCRSIGEIANLLLLFQCEPDAFTAWKVATKEERQKQFGPVKVRKRLSTSQYALGSIGHERYAALSELAAHVNPKTKPQAHNIFGIPSAAQHYQEAGLLVCLNELGLAVGLVNLGAAALLEFDRDRRIEILTASRKMIENLGGIDITTVQSHYDKMRSSPIFPVVEQALKELQAEARRPRKLGGAAE